MENKKAPEGPLAGGSSLLSAEPNQALLGIIKAHGLRDERTVRALQLLLRVEIAPVLSSVAIALMDEGIRSGKIPANVGRATEDFLIAASAAIEDLVRDYHMQGNPLTSRYVEPEQLTEEIWRFWKGTFSSLVHTPEKDMGTGMQDPEIQDRLTVVALKMREIILERTSEMGGEATPVGYFLDADRLEGLCHEAAKALFVAFNNPNETNHALIHGEKK